MRSIRELRALFDSGRPLLYVMTAEERRVGGLLRHAAQHFFAKPVPLWTWSLTEGLHGEGGTPVDDVNNDPRSVLDFIADLDGPGLFHLKDFHEPMRGSAVVRRRLRDLNALCADRGKFAVISSPVQFLPDELARDIAYLELDGPDFAELRALLATWVAALKGAGAGVDTGDAALFSMARALQGLTLDEAGYALKRALAGDKTRGFDFLPALIEEKRLTVKRTGTIEYVADGGAMESVGGLGVMKKWLQDRKSLFQPRDDTDAEMVPKGVLVMGVSGCGKSLSIKAIASSFGLPLYRIDMAEIFSGRHGPPEWAFVHACRTMEAVAPAVVWFDEIELGITSAATAGEQGRIFAFFLTWMQEKVRGLFVAATANRIDLLPAEMIRKGRFDEVFFVDLPHDDERIEIFRIHLSRRGADPAKLDVERLVGPTIGWSGAEVEQCVASAIMKARLAGREVTFDDLFQVATRIVPLSKTMKEKVDQLRNWARDRAAPASLRK
ncbi:MAG: AAA family ATPase [Betaproteobacteria bacterium]